MGPTPAILITNRFSLIKVIYREIFNDKDITYRAPRGHFGTSLVAIDLVVIAELPGSIVKENKPTITARDVSLFQALLCIHFEPAVERLSLIHI